MGVPPVPDLSWIAPRARELRNDPTDTDRVLWRALRRRRFAGHMFRRPAPIGSYIVDFVSFDARLVVKVNGAQHLEPQRAHDTARDAWLRDQGSILMRFWNSDVMNAPNEVEQAIWNALEDAPPPRPSPLQGREQDSEPKHDDVPHFP